MAWHLTGQWRGNATGSMELFKTLVEQYGGTPDSPFWWRLSDDPNEPLELWARFDKLPTEHTQICERLKQAGFTDLHFMQPK